MQTIDFPMDLVVEGFDWDEGNRAKCQTHGVSIEEIEPVLWGQPRVAPDPAHSENEDRLNAIGRNHHGRPLFVAFTRERQSTIDRADHSPIHACKGDTAL